MWKHIETYINQNREDLDRMNPPGDLWAKIESDLAPPHRPQVRSLAAFDNWMRLAAAIVLIVGGAWLWLRVVPEHAQPASSLLPMIHEIQDASSAWNQAEADYISNIKAIEQQLQEGWEQSPVFESMAEDIRQVEAELNQIRESHSLVVDHDSLYQELILKQKEHLSYLGRLIQP